MGDYFAVEVDDCGEITDLAKCKSLTSAKRWVSSKVDSDGMTKTQRSIIDK